MSDEKELFYLNLELTNDQLRSVEGSLNVVYSNNIIDTPRDWNMSIVRFQIDASLIPLFVPVIPNPANPLVTNMSVTLEYSGVYYQEFVSVTAQEAKNGIFDYQLFLDHVNTSLATAFASIPPGPSSTLPPSLYIDPKTGLITMYCELGYMEGAANRIRIGFNQYLEEILNLPSVVSYGPGAAFGFDEEIAVKSNAILLPSAANRFGYPYALSLLGVTLVGVSQEYRSLTDWNHVKSIYFVSSSLPVIKEVIPVNVTQLQSRSVSTGISPIITDFDIIKDDLSITSRRIIEYLPTANFRWAQLTGTNPFNTIDVAAYYRDYLGRTGKVMLTSGASMSLKIMFRKKSSHSK